MFDGKRGWEEGGWRRLTGIRARGRHRVEKRNEAGQTAAREKQRERKRERQRERETGFRFGVSRRGREGRHGISREADHEWTRLPQLCR